MVMGDLLLLETEIDLVKVRAALHSTTQQLKIPANMENSVPRECRLLPPLSFLPRSMTKIRMPTANRRSHLL
jgi:hypothetical protein